MAEPTIQLGGGNWAGKTDNLLGYYKEGERFYKQDFTFSRSTTGTYTDKDGYIQEMPYNLLEQSNNFDTTWTTTRASLTSGKSGYDGSSNAWAMVDNTDNSTHLLVQFLTTIEGKATFSIYAKAGDVDFMVFRFEGATVDYAYFNLSNGSIGTVDANYINVNITDVGNGWYKCEATNESVNKAVILTAQSDNDPTYAGAGTTAIYIQDAQVVKGTSAKTYFPTTTRLNMPRVSYLNNSNGSLILEPQRTNLVTYSSDFSNAAWVKDNVTITSDATTSPEGISNATKLIPNTSTALHRLRSNTITISTNGAYSAFVKADGYSKVALREDNAVGNYASFDLSNGSVLDENASGVADIDSYGNGWYRIYFVDNAVSATCQLSFYVLPDSYTSGSPTATNWAADGTKGIYIYGAQVEQGSYPTTLINTSGSSVTRNADVCSITNVADRIGQTEGTIFVDFQLDQAPSDINGRLLQLWATNDTTNSIIPFVNQSRQLQITTFGSSDGTPIIVAGPSTLLGLGRNKIAVAYTSTSVVVYRNGVLFASGDPTGFFPTSLTSLDLGCSSFAARNLGNPINQAQLYNTRLTDSELATLTTL